MYLIFEIDGGIPVDGSFTAFARDTDAIAYYIQVARECKFKITDERAAALTMDDIGDLTYEVSEFLEDEDYEIRIVSDVDTSMYDNKFCEPLYSDELTSNIIEGRYKRNTEQPAYTAITAEDDGEYKLMIYSGADATLNMDYLINLYFYDTEEQIEEDIRTMQKYYHINIKY